MSLRINRTWALTLVLAIGGAATAPAATLSARFPADPANGDFSARPAHFNSGDPATRAYFRRSVAAGESFSDAVVVVNTGSSPVSLHVYATDGLTGATSGVVYSGRLDPLHGAGWWLTPAVSDITLAPYSRRQVQFTVHVPTGAPPGDHLAGIALENAQPQHSGGRFTITEILREVVGVEIQVPGAAAPSLRLSHVSLNLWPGTGIPALAVTLADAGTKLCKPRLAVSLSQGSAVATRFTRQLNTILPGDRITFPILWPRTLRAGTYQAAVRGTGCGRPRILRRTARLGSPLTATPRHPDSTPQAGSAAPADTKWWLLALVAVAGAAIGMGVAGGRMAHDRGRALTRLRGGRWQRSQT